MARLGKRSLMYGVRGMFGGQVVYKKRMGKRYVAAPPKVNKYRKPGAAEQANRDRFKESNAYAAWAVTVTSLKEMYQAAAKKRQTANNVAFQDAYYSPEVLGILTHSYKGSIGNIITINAKDNFKVVKVSVSIYNSENKLLENGSATANPDGISWNYVAEKDNPELPGCKIKASAFDTPGKEGSLEVIL
jgi:hypothetical protein